ncbi:MAG: hypothetical protein PHG93_02125, partial [Candidatus Methanomethylophilaceae archaeon]|nr:hypothetical protein [Candidatus Methanomethylophilaceae archaeon]
KGREPVLRTFETFLPSEKSVEEVIEFEMGKFSVYMDMNKHIEDTIKDIVQAHSNRGMVHYDGKKKLGLLTWVPP